MKPLTERLTSRDIDRAVLRHSIRRLRLSRISESDEVLDVVAGRILTELGLDSPPRASCGASPPRAPLSRGLQVAGSRERQPRVSDRAGATEFVGNELFNRPVIRHVVDPYAPLHPRHLRRLDELEDVLFILPSELDRLVEEHYIAEDEAHPDDYDVPPDIDPELVEAIEAARREYPRVWDADMLLTNASVFEAAVVMDQDDASGFDERHDAVEIGGVLFVAEARS